ncbi:hypothetical protein JW921_00185, partial [Candidatus Fermentibacterales bacterium]|nr:hypothetical protein [Candidatus Fermentibacterales bacterium]
VEIVVRGYLTGTTSTSAWTMYRKGERNVCGNVLPDGMRKNQRFPEPILTPTTKSDEHDEPVSEQQILERGLVAGEDWSKLRETAFRLFSRGASLALENGLILVDTKYELGKDEQGRTVLIDEIHTPDSSRYWLAEGYDSRFRAGEEPENIDKEFLRRWFAERCDPYSDEVLPKAPPELVVELSRRYVYLYELITGLELDVSGSEVPVLDRIRGNLRGAGLAV